MALTEQQKSEVRRALRYPESGSSAGGLGPPFFAEMGTGAGLLGFPTDPANLGLNWRLEHLPTDVEVKIVGADHPSFDVYCAAAGVDTLVTVPGSIVAGDPAILQIDKQSVEYVVTGSDTAATIAQELAALVNADSVLGGYLVAIANAGTIAIRARQWGSRGNSTSVAAFFGPSLAIAVYQPGTTTPTKRLYGGGDPPGPRFLNAEATPAFPIYGHLPIIRFWEDQIGLAADGMDTVRADVFTQERNEYAKRRSAYYAACRDLAQDLGIQFAGGGSFDGRGARRRVT
jgi:hypothetical protein